METMLPPHSTIVFLFVFFEPTDRRKALKALLTKQYKFKYASPNIAELRAMAKFLEPNNPVVETSDVNEIVNLSRIVSKFIEVIIVTMGRNGVTTVRGNADNQKLDIRYYPVTEINSVENVSGAGDCFASGYIHGVLLGYLEPFCVSLGFEAAKTTLFCKSTVPNKFQLPTNLCASSFQSF